MLINIILNLYIPRSLNLQRATAFQMVDLNVLHFVQRLRTKSQFLVHANDEVCLELVEEIVRGMNTITSLILNVVPFKNVI